ncbi:MAG: hypothetical protein AB7U20_15180 [Planctomycetaceae bacterium]
MTDRIEFPQTRCLVGVARGDVTPPVGIYHRMWGAAAHDRATGVHRPLTFTVLVLAPEDSGDVRGEGLVLLALDHCLMAAPDLGEILERVASEGGVPRERIIVFFSHTHAAGLLGRERFSMPGGDLIPGYFAEMSEKLAAGVNTAAAAAQPATIVYGAGQCPLATNRDYFDSAAGHYVCGFNPGGPADPTVLVARVHSHTGDRPLATLVNYACHPTTLAWDNTLISPDYVGAMREVVEQAADAPCFFIQGASGDIGPREGYVGDTEVADRNGRMLGYAALSALETLPPPGTAYQYTGPVISGATIGTWCDVPIDQERERSLAFWEEHESTLALKYRPDRPDKETLLAEKQIWEQREQSARAAGNAQQASDARAMLERITRRLARVGHLPPGDTMPFSLRIWRLGDAVWVALDGEHYNVLQRQLRERFPDIPLIVGTLANGSNVWYLPDRDSYGKGLYQEEVSILARGSLETIIDAAAGVIKELMDATSALAAH